MKTNRYGDTSCYSSYGSPQGWSLQCPNWNSKYRTIDGSCNNVRHPYWGKSYVCHIRLLPPDYADGVSEPRLSHDGSPLPNTRTVSNIVTADKPFESFYTHLKMSFGQYVNHDITHTPVFGSYALSSSYSGPTDCCRDRRNKQCYPIDIEPTPYDYQYRKYNNTCLNFIRSAPCPLCELGMNFKLKTIDWNKVFVLRSATADEYRHIFHRLRNYLRKYSERVVSAQDIQIRFYSQKFSQILYNMIWLQVCWRLDKMFTESQYYRQLPLPIRMNAVLRRLKCSALLLVISGVTNTRLSWVCIWFFCVDTTNTWQPFDWWTPTGTTRLSIRREGVS